MLNLGDDVLIAIGSVSAQWATLEYYMSRATHSCCNKHGNPLPKLIGGTFGQRRDASATTKIISDAVCQWHPLRNQQSSNGSEVTAASTKDDIGAFRKSHHHSQWDTSEFGQPAEANQGT
jgi:hypothetical protein